MKINSILVILTFLSMACVSASQEDFSQKDLLGFWKGEFPHDSTLNMIFYFWEEDGNIVGNSFIAGKKSIENENPVYRVKLEKTELVFDIPSQGIEFSAEINPEKLTMTGGAYVPSDKPVYLSFEKVSANRVPLSAEMIERCKPIDINKKYSKAELQSDFALLRKDLEESHPQLYLYNSKGNFDDFFELQYQKIRNNMTLVEFARIVAPVIAKIGCGHTQMKYNRKFMDAFQKEKKFIPFKLKVIGSKLFIINNFSNKEVEEGAEIIAINGKFTSDIYPQLLSFFSSDGKNITFKIHEINRDFALAYHYLESPDRFELVIQSRESLEREKILVDGIGGKEYYQKLEVASNGKNDALLKFDVNHAKNYAIMRIKAFMNPNPEEFYRFLSASFSELRDASIQNLVIDLRGNYGGPPFHSAELLSYIAKEPIIYFGKEYEQTFLEELTKPLKVKLDRFNGDIYLLVDGGCFSSTGHFLSLVRYHGLGVIVGETSGGSFYCNDNSKFVSLPKTQMDVSIAQTTFETKIEGMDKGDELQPDYQILMNVEDVLNGVDTQLDFVLRLIENNEVGNVAEN